MALKTYDIAPKHFSISDLMEWQRSGTLNLHPKFQRRSVWKPGAKSYLIDTIVRGLPVPLIFLQERIDVSMQRKMRDVVDGQQRLRTIFGYIDPGLLKDFDPSRDKFSVKRTHNREIAGYGFDALDEHYQRRILDYNFSVLVLPDEITERQLLEIFARLNSTGMKLNHQELRNAEYFGEMKTILYELAYDQMERWLAWRVVTEDQVTRMFEVELTSDLIYNMLYGLSGKSQARLNRMYREFDSSFEISDEVARRFRTTMDEIDAVFGRHIPGSIFEREVFFFTLFVFFYDQLYGLPVLGGSSRDRSQVLDAFGARRTQPRKLSPSVQSCLLEASRRFSEWEVPPEVIDAVSRASSDLGRRQKRFEFLQEVCEAEA